MTLIAEIIVSLFLIGGGIFALIGSLGMVRLRDTMQRMHAPTKATTLGVGGVLIASMLYFLLVQGELSYREILIVLFLLVTAPITGNFIAKVYIQGNVRNDDLPGTNTESGWAVYDEPPVR
jgi:multicomponent K+:H+ antiporter subunit G